MDGGSAPYIIPARRMQWVASCLACQYGLVSGIENEVLVLGTGLEQYLQEIFHHLDSEGKGTVTWTDFRILCDVLNLSSVKNLPRAGEQRMEFKEFHARLSEVFANEVDMPFIDPEDASKRREHVSIQASVPPRQGITVKTMCLECYQAKPLTEIYKSFLCEKTDPGRRATEEGNSESAASGDTGRLAIGDSGTCTADGNNGQETLQELEEQNEALREIIEDMRVSLQRSDAQSLALQVELMRSHQNHKECPVKAALRDTQNQAPQAHSKDVMTLMKELERLRQFRDRELKEMLLANQNIESDLLKTRCELLDAENVKVTLTRNQEKLRDELRQARRTIAAAVDKVWHLEKEANKVGDLQTQLEALRKERPVTDVKLGGPIKSCVSDSQSDESSEEQLERSVEGKSASDEETEEKTATCSNKRRHSSAAKAITEKLQARIGQLQEEVLQLCQDKQTVSEETEEMKEDLMQEITERKQECEQLRNDLRGVEVDRIRLALIEETTFDLFHLLQNLREKHVSRRLTRLLGKTLFDTLESCDTNKALKPEQTVQNFLNSLQKELLYQDSLVSANSYSQSGSNCGELNEKWIANGNKELSLPNIPFATKETTC